MSQKYRYEEMLPCEFLEAVQKMPVFLVPTGLLEWHADHLPLGQDGLKAHGICMEIAKKLDGGIVLPTNYYGRPGFASYLGTLTYSEECLTLLFMELMGELKKVGARVILILTGHYGPCQVDFVKKAAENFMAANPEITVIAQPEYEDVTVDGKVPADHAGTWESSMFWYLHPELTHMEAFQEIPSKKQYYKNPPNGHYEEKEEWVWRQDVLSEASPELGKKAIDIISDNIVKKIQRALKSE